MSEREEPEPTRGIQRQRAEPAALIAEEPSSSRPVVPVAPHPGFDFISRSPVFDPAGRVNVIWESSRVDEVNQVFATRWNAAEAETAVPTDAAPRQVTAGSAAHWHAAVVVLPGGDLVVAYETAGADIYFKRAPFEGLAAAVERPVATSQREMEKFPFVVRSGRRLVFFWMSADRHDPRPLWRVRVRTYTPAWTEAEASWGPAHDLSQTRTFLEGGPVVLHAAVDEAGEIWAAFQTAAKMIQAVRLDPATGQTTQPDPFHISHAKSKNPAVVVDGDRAVWVFWEGGQRIFSQRLRRDLDAPQWDTNPTPVPGAATGSEENPAAVRDAAGVIWLFWSRSRPDPDATPDEFGELVDLYLARHHPATGWEDPLRVSASPLSGLRPVPALAPGGRIWLFWSDANPGHDQADLFFKQLRAST
jgi:hypothetical protein